MQAKKASTYTHKELEFNLETNKRSPSVISEKKKKKRQEMFNRGRKTMFDMEEVKAETKPEEKVEEKKEEKAEEEKKEETPAPEEKKDEEKKEDEPPKPPAPVILYVDLHCVGCAKKIERSIMKIRGVEGVHIDMATNQVTIKGIIDPQAICLRIQKKIRRSAKIISPLPAAEGEPIPQVVTSQVGGLVSVELNVNMHCEGCALQLKRKILKMRGVQTAETELSTGKVTVTGTMDAERLVDYVYRRTKKQARIVPQPEPEPVKEEEKKEGEKPAEEAAKPEENAEKKEGDEKPAEGGGGEEEKKGEDGGENKENEEKGGENKEEGGGSKEEGDNEPQIQYINYEEPMKKMMYYYPPMYVIERVPAPQLFSDENPNACCIS